LRKLWEKTWLQICPTKTPGLTTHSRTKDRAHMWPVWEGVHKHIRLQRAPGHTLPHQEEQMFLWCIIRPQVILPQTHEDL
jgi:hypothetical protein